MAESLGSDPYDSVCVAVLAEHLAEYVGVAGEVALPKIVADDAPVGESVGAVVRIDEPSERRFEATEFG